MEKPNAESALKHTSHSASQWSSRATTIDELREKLYDKTKVTRKLYLVELQKKQEEELQKMIEEEEIRLLRKEMIPRAQLMPHFDRPFFPQR